MATYEETSNGGAIPGGCAIVKYVDVILTTFGPGDVLYSVHKARKGVMEKIVIKKPRLANLERTQGYPVILYVDTLNGLWNEDELIPFNEAQELAIEYWNSVIAYLDENDAC